MIEYNGKLLNEALLSLGVQGEERARIISNAGNILEKVVASYEGGVGTGHVGSDGTGVPAGFAKSDLGPIGLVYGRIQSGKTRAMIAATGMAFDNGFRIAVVLTSNINDLVSQTHRDFASVLRGVAVYTKDDELTGETEDAKLELQSADGRILIIASKGSLSLKNITAFLVSIGAQNFPMLIFDDEGDQASLDTNTYKRSSTGKLTTPASPINRMLRKIRTDFPASVYVAVTGTPQAVLLQSSVSDNKPSFVVMLPPGNGYIGGDQFFDTQEPEDCTDKLIHTVPVNDKPDLLSKKTTSPSGLSDAILYFLLSATAASRHSGFPDKGYQFLCHPSIINDDQKQASKKINSFLTEVKKVLMDQPDTFGILASTNRLYTSLTERLGADRTPPLNELKLLIRQELRRKKILVINAKQKRQGIEYGPGLNFLIGGNTLGRGIAIPNLLVTYYVRTAKVSQIDTMHQHARMFGYRNHTLPYTKLFIPKTLYYRFRDIHYSDKGLRDFISRHVDSYPNSFPVEISSSLRATRKGVLDINHTDIVWPGMQIFPNYLRLPQTKAALNTVVSLLAKEFGVQESSVLAETLKSLESRGNTDGVEISVAKAIEIVSHIKTQSKNSWHDGTIAAVINKLSQRLGQKVRLKFRRASRTVEENGGLSSGTLEGRVQAADRLKDHPTLWIMAVTAKADSESAPGETFMFPTIVVPNRLPQVFVFSKK